jgi:hypothetical protein
MTGHESSRSRADFEQTTATSRARANDAGTEFGFIVGIVTG